MVIGQLQNEGDVDVANALAQKYNILDEQIKALADTLDELENRWRAAHQTIEQGEQQVKEAINQTTEAERQMNAEADKSPTGFREQWSAVTELHDRIRGLTEELHKYEAEYDKISEKPGFDDQSKRVRELQEEIARLKKEIEGAKSELNTMPSGAGSFLAEWKEKLYDILTGNNKFTESLGGIKTALGGLMTPLSSATSGVVNITKALWAMASTPIGAVISAVVVGLQAMFSWFNKSAEGQRAFAKITAFLGSLLSSITDIAIKLGGYLYHAFTDPQGSLNQFGKGLINFVVNPLKAVANTLAGVGKIAKGVYDLISSGANIAEAKRAAGEIADGWERLKKAGSNIVDTLKAGWDVVAGGVSGAFSLAVDGVGKIWKTDLSKVGSDIISKATQMAQLAEQQKNAEIQLAEAKKNERLQDIEIAKEREKIYTLTGKEKDAQIEKVKNMIREKYDPQIQAQQTLLDIQKKRNDLHTKSLESIAKEREAQGQVYALMAQQASSTRMLVRMQQANLKSMGNAANREENKQNRITTEDAKWEEVVRKNAIERAKVQVSLEEMIADARIEAMKDGETKVLAQRTRNFEKELNQLEENRRAAIEAERKRQKAEFEAQEAVVKAKGGKVQSWDDGMIDQTEIDKINSLYEKVKELLAQKDKIATEKYEREQQRANQHTINSYLKQYGDYAQQKAAILSDADLKIKEAQERLNQAKNEETQKAIEAEIEILRKGADKEITELKRKFGKLPQFLADLFADTSNKSIKELSKIIKKYEAFLKYREGNKDISKEDLMKDYGFGDDEINELSEKLKTGELSIKDFTEKIKALRKNLEELSRTEVFKKLAEEIKTAFNGRDIGQGLIKFGSLLQETSSLVGDIGESIGGIFNIHGDEFKNMQTALNNIGNLALGIGRIYSGDYIGGAVNAASGIAGIISMLSNEEEKLRAYQQEQNKNRTLLETIDRSLNKLSDALEKSYGIAALQLSEQRQELIKEKQESAQKSVKETGFGQFLMSEMASFLHSEGLRGGNIAYEIGKRYGLDTKFYDWESDNAERYRDLSDVGLGSWRTILTKADPQELASVLHDIRENDKELWAEIIAMDSETAVYFEALADTVTEYNDNIEQLREQLTTTTRDNIFTGFLDNLYNLASGSKDVFDSIADNWQEMVNKMAVNNIVGEKFRQKLEQWYEQLAKVNEERAKISEDATEAEIAAANAAYLESLEELKGEYKNHVENAQKEIEQLRNLGIIKATGENVDQQATYNSLEKWTYDQADEIINRATAIQIIDEHILEGQQSMTDAMIGLLGGINGMSGDIILMAENMAIAVDLHQQANDKLDRIIINTNVLPAMNDLLKRWYNNR